MGRPQKYLRRDEAVDELASDERRDHARQPETSVDRGDLASGEFQLFQMRHEGRGPGAPNGVLEQHHDA